MPNDCWNKLYIAAEEETIENMYESEFLDMINNDNIKCTLIKKYPKGMILNIWSPWEPDYLWLETLIDKYECWIKNVWDEDGGYAGVWIGTFKNEKKIINKIIWEDLCIEALNYHFSDNSDLIEKEDFINR
tara:strand:- start:9791 stop:10183 length:393 start_codon:yes stop_codon:yes gene_type:complete